MAPSPTSLLLSFDSTLQPFLLPSSSSFPPRPSPSSLARRLIRVASRSIPLASTSRSTTLLTASSTLNDFNFRHDFTHGFILIRPMLDNELDETVQLLAESFSEVMFGTDRYVQLLIFLVKQYIEERLKLVPHTAVLVGFYTETNSSESHLVCTAEVSFDAIGANAAVPTPQPPPDYPYICNMTTKKSHRRKGIAWQLLQACEDLILRMKVKRQVYLHCRVVDKGPFALYTKAGYEVVKRDSIMVWLTLQRRKYLMRKIIPLTNYVQANVRTEDLSTPNDTQVTQQVFKAGDLPPSNDRHPDVKYLPQQNDRHLEVKPEDRPQQLDSHMKSSHLENDDDDDGIF
ncbi:Acyl-CoA N-acyltransferase protein [Dioscorea alata]|uniref:Acyl-CoA N-acyltransferase protein n=1 Tax=Dioscorea alata TaxID=55571 RepID=A0ACB7WLK3_DIOAL|nr:Acyl-CoA N-acyltransferase protein [Dioscorea alata]